MRSALTLFLFHLLLGNRECSHFICKAQYLGRIYFAIQRHMQKVLAVSRWVSTNSTYQKQLKDEYNIHKKKIDQIMTRERSVKRSHSNPYLQLLKKSKQANHKLLSQSSALNPVKQENIALISRIESIQNRKLSLNNLKTTSVHLANHKPDHHENSSGAYASRQKQRQIQIENVVIRKKMEQVDRQALTKKDIKNEFKQYIRIRDSLRRFKHPQNFQSSKKLSHRRNKSPTPSTDSNLGTREAHTTH